MGPVVGGWVLRPPSRVARGRPEWTPYAASFPYAYPEVERYIVSILEEIAGYPVDGICLLYDPAMTGVVEYEPPIVESFLKKYGRDPRQLDARNPQWLAHRATFLTGFMKSVRRSIVRTRETRACQTAEGFRRGRHQ